MRTLRLPTLFVLLFSVACGGGGSGGGPTDEGPAGVGALSGVVEVDGRGAASGTVRASRTGQTSKTATPTASGLWTIADLAVGAWTVQLTPGSGHALADGESGTRGVTVLANQSVAVSAFQVRTAGPQSGVVEIHLTAGSQFSPNTLTITPGTTVRWINDSATAHTVTPENASQPGVWTRRETSATGVVFEHTFTVSGQTYRYRCEPHSSSFSSGMVGTITVT